MMMNWSWLPGVAWVLLEVRGIDLFARGRFDAAQELYRFPADR
jgi:hypothetical protein